MIYTELTKKAINIAFKAHAGQMDRSGYPYILHPIHLAEQMDTEDACVVAILHDVVEDTNVTFDDLKAEGIRDNQLEALKLLTHDIKIPYMEYIMKLKENPLAKKVKIADLIHNSDLSRMGDELTECVLNRNKKYKEALKMLME